MGKINDKLIEFIDKTPNAYCCVNNLKGILIENGFIELYENEIWKELKEDGKYFVTRNDSSLIAFKMCSNVINPGFNITATHTDSPSFSIKTNPEMYENGYLKLNTSSYGGMINYSWLDRPLSLAGRVIVLDKGVYKKQIINIDKDLLVIPSQAIHINREVNSKCELNYQTDMLPIMSLSDVKLKNLIEKVLEKSGVFFDKVCDYDLYLYNRDKVKPLGLEEEFIMGPRLDDLASLVPSFYSFINSNNQDTYNVFCAFNNEEIGSLTPHGADSSFLIDILTKIASSTKIDLLTTLNNSIVVSADNAHAIHPNAASKSDPSNKVYLNKGVVIKHHTNYTTDSLTSSIFKDVCERVSVPYQDFECRSDMRCGATLGGVSQRHVSVDSVDIGIPQLAMHSANEMIGSKDTLHMYKALLEFYQTSFMKDKNGVKIKIK
ncbi:MAG: M18 family aminopeptidase [Firmicutes bacterium]|nr:M18 family aminopeptidase [Bacillota bacterium]